MKHLIPPHKSKMMAMQISLFKQSFIFQIDSILRLHSILCKSLIYWNTNTYSRKHMFYQSAPCKKPVCFFFIILVTIGENLQKFITIFRYESCSTVMVSYLSSRCYHVYILCLLFSGQSQIFFCLLFLKFFPQPVLLSFHEDSCLSLCNSLFIPIFISLPLFLS